MIERPLYVDKIMAYTDTPFVKILAGVRRCGKSTILKMIMEKLLERCWQKQEPKEKLLAQGGRVELLYWDPAENKSFVIPAKG